MRTLRARRLRNAAATWAMAVDFDRDDLGTIAEFYCPDCTTAAEHIAVELSEVSTDYAWVGDRIAKWPKVLN